MRPSQYLPEALQQTQREAAEHVLEAPNHAAVAGQIRAVLITLHQHTEV